MAHHAECEGTARGALGTDEFRIAYREGSSLAFDSAIQLGLEIELDE